MHYTSAGESHGQKNVVIISDVPSGISLSEKEINFDLKRRSAGAGRSARQDAEANSCKIVSGVADGKTTGAPICIEVENSVRDSNLNTNIVRPGHADFSGVIKHNFDNTKIVTERASARETVARVAAGVVAKNMLAALDIEVFGYVCAIGGAAFKENHTNMPDELPSQTDIAMSDVMCPDAEISKDMLDQIIRAANHGESLGGQFKIAAVGMAPGIGGYASGEDRIDAKIASAVLSVPSVKGIEIGSANFASQNVGSASLDAIDKDEANGGFIRTTNYSGGIEGGMTNGMPIVLAAFVKPVPTINKPVQTLDLESMEIIEFANDARADVCVVPNAAVVCEAEVSLVLANEIQKKFGHDALSEIEFAYNAYKQRIKQLS